VDHGADVVIAQGIEAGGHRGTFLTTDHASQLGTLALVPQVVDAVKVPVIAAGGIADGSGIAAALALGASAVQMGRYLLPLAHFATYRANLKAAGELPSVITNVLTGLPARVFMNRITRELGPLATGVPAFPLPAAALNPLRLEAEFQGSSDFSTHYAGLAAALCRELPAGELTLKFAAEGLERLGMIGRAS
jgi:nitronate monooxygenase